MTSAPVASPVPRPERPELRSGPLRWFWSASAAAVLVLSVVGFRHFFLHGQSYPGRPITPPIRELVIAHGVAMSAWLVLMIVQPLLVATRRVRVHMTLGRVGAVLAAGIVVLGFVLATRSAAVAPPGAMIGPFTARQFMAVPYSGALVFGLCVGIGVWQRKRPDVHRPMIFLGTLSAFAAAMDRIDGIRDLYAGTFLYAIWGPFFSALAVGVVLLALKCALARSFDRWFAGGLAALFVVFAVTVQVATSPAWERFAARMTG
jgi:hypothetical protein